MSFLKSGFQPRGTGTLISGEIVILAKGDSGELRKMTEGAVHAHVRQVDRHREDDRRVVLCKSFA